MPQFITRQDPLADTWRANADAAQLQRRQDEEAAEIARRKKRALVGLGLGAVGGLVAAPLLGLAGSAAGFAGDAALGMSVPTAATPGLLGFGGNLSGIGALTAAATGAQIGGQFGNEDYMGGAASLAGVGLSAATRQQNVATYGFDASPEDRQAIARQAARLGTSVGQLSQMPGGAMQNLRAMTQSANEAAQWETLARDSNFDGTGFDLANAAQSNPRGVQGAISDGRIRQGNDAATIAAMRSAAEFKQGEANMLGTPESPGGWESQPDQRDIDESSDGYRAIEDQVSAYDESGGKAGRPWSEQGGALQELVKLQQKGVNGRLAPKERQFKYVDPKTGQMHETPYGVASPIGGKMVYPHRKADGGDGVVTWDAEKEQKEQVWEQPAPPNVDPAAWEAFQTTEAKKYKRVHFGVKLGEEDNYIFDGKGGLEKRAEGSEENKTTRAVRRQKFIDAITKPNDLGEVIGGTELLSAVSTWEQADNAAEVIGDVFRELEQVTTKGSTPERNAALMARLQTLPGAPDASILKAMNILRASEPPPPEPMGPPAPPPPPPGSAADAEQPMTRSQQMKATRQAISPAGKAKAETARQAEIGKVAEKRTAGMPEKMAQLYETVAIQNIQAGIDAPVGIIDQNGNVRQVLKNSLTPERIAELKAAGFSVPGLEGD